MQVPPTIATRGFALGMEEGGINPKGNGCQVLEEPLYFKPKEFQLQGICFIFSKPNYTCQWRIYIQKFPACAPPPQQDQILSFLHMFSPKSACVRGWCPLQRGLAPPQREILDPPLHVVKTFESPVLF